MPASSTTDLGKISRQPENAGTPISRYDANIQLIRRRLADEHRTTKSKPWWKSR